MGELKIEHTAGIRVLHNDKVIWSGEKRPGITDAMDEICSRKLYSFSSNGYYDGRNWLAPGVLVVDCTEPPILMTSEDVETFLHEVVASPFTAGVLMLSGTWSNGMRTRHFKVFPGQYVELSSGDAYNAESIEALCETIGAQNVEVILSMPNAPVHRGEYICQSLERELAIEELFL
jgi:hypothetical protein